MIQRSELEVTAMQRAEDWRHVAELLFDLGESMYYESLDSSFAREDWREEARKEYEAVAARWHVAIYKVPGRAWRHGG